jgi:hypothetical protein
MLRCKKCNELVEDQFDSCWNCGNEELVQISEKKGKKKTKIISEGKTEEVAKCSYCKEMDGILADFYYGKKVVLDVIKTQEGGMEVTTTKYKVEDIHHNCDYYLCNKCVKEYNNQKRLIAFSIGIFLILISIIILKEIGEDDNVSLIGYLFLFIGIIAILIGIIIISKGFDRSIVSLAYFSSKFKSQGFNIFFHPKNYEIFLKDKTTRTSDNRLDYY